MSDEKHVVLLIHSNESRIKELAEMLEYILEENEVDGYFEVVPKSFQNKIVATMAIKSMEPIFVVAQNKMWNQNDAGFDLLEYFCKKVKDFPPFYSLLHGTGINEERKKRSLDLHECSSFHLGTCSQEKVLDEILVEKVAGVLMQDEDYVVFEHIESSTVNTIEKTFSGITKPLYPLKEAIIRFETGDGKCFEGVTELLLHMESELRRIRENFNELFNLRIEARRLGKIDETVRMKTTDVSIVEAFSEVNRFLTDPESPLVQLENWMNAIPQGQTKYYQVYQHLETIIGDYNILGYCRVFLQYFRDFEENLKVIDEYLGAKV